MVSQPKDETPLEPAPVSAGGTYAIQTVSVGCKLYIQRDSGNRTSTGEIEWEERRAEILSIRERPETSFSITRSVPSPTVVSLPDAADALEFFVHWEAFNKRLDGWVPGSRLVLSREMEWPRPKANGAPKKLAGAALKAQQRLQGQIGKGQSGSAARRTASPGPNRGKTPRRDSLLKKASVNAARAASQTPVDSSAPYIYPTPDAYHPDVMFAPSLKKQISDGFDDDGELEMEEPAVSLLDLGQEPEDLDAEGSLDLGLDDGEDMDIDADGSETQDLEQDADDDQDDEEGEGFDIGSTESGLAPPPLPLATFSKEAEIEKLRTSGSMTQSVSEVARVKNLNRIQMGAYEVDAWYFSPYPREYAHLPVLYLCEFCLFYFPSSFTLGRHRKRCKLLHPPGNEIYRHEDISFYELDGKRQLQYCRNLSLLSKCFLDHKTLYYDVTPFLYYVMCQRDSSGAHIIGYFSKEKESAESYNVACILTLPQHQRFGYGKLLIEFSYELSKREGKHGSPEKPLSDLGLLGYRAYWAEAIVELLIQEVQRAEPDKADITVDDISNRTAITHADVMNTCFTLQLFKNYRTQNVICLTDAILERHEKARARRKRRIKPEALIWKPPVFTRDQLRFGW